MKPIAHIYTDFPTKFGLPRQSGLIEELEGKIVMEPEFRTMEAFRGIEQFSHLWIIWKFSESKKEHWAATVCPPRLGGKVRMGVFATRSPFRPNDIGLSCVKLKGIQMEEGKGPVLLVSGIDMMDKTPIYDIKPYIKYADCHPNAEEGYTEITKKYELFVKFPEQLLNILPMKKRKAAIEMLKQDPRPAYNKILGKQYGVEFGGYDIRFVVEGTVLTVHEVVIVK